MPKRTNRSILEEEMQKAFDDCGQSYARAGRLLGVSRVDVSDVLNGTKMSNKRVRDLLKALGRYKPDRRHRVTVQNPVYKVLRGAGCDINSLLVFCVINGVHIDMERSVRSGQFDADGGIELIRRSLERQT